MMLRLPPPPPFSLSQARARTHTHTQTSITAEIKGGVKTPITNDSAMKFRFQSEHQTFCQPFSLPSYDTFVAAATGTDFHHCQGIHLVQ